MIEHYSAKVANLLQLAAQQTNIRVHLARQKLLFALIMSMIETRSVQFTELATKLNSQAKDESNLRRIQAFFAHYPLNYQWIACMLMTAIERRKCRLSIDRTNWQFGQTTINILTLTVYSQGIGIPLFFELLDKDGNSKAQERIDLLAEFVAVFGRERIESLTADREFVGHQWFKWLIDQQIPFAIRFPASHHLTLRNGQCCSAAELLADQSERYFEQIFLDGVRLNVALKKLHGDYLLVAGTHRAKRLLKQYVHRWSIECFFQSIKERGFRLEETHLSDLDRLKKLMAVVSLAFMFCHRVGSYSHKHRAAIALKSHGYKANSFFRKGLNLLRSACKWVEKRADLLAHYLSWLGRDESISFGK